MVKKTNTDGKINIHIDKEAFRQHAEDQANFVDQFCDFLDENPGLAALLSHGEDDNVAQGLRDYNNELRRKSGMPIPEPKKTEPEQVKPKKKDRFGGII